MMKGSDAPFVVTDKKSAIKGMNLFFDRHGVDGIECPAGFKGFEVEAVHLYESFGKDDAPGKTGKVFAAMKVGKERIPVRGYILDGTFSALVSPAAFAYGPTRAKDRVRERLPAVLHAFAFHFEEWHADDDMALMFRVMESCLNAKPFKTKKGGRP